MSTISRRLKIIVLLYRSVAEIVGHFAEIIGLCLQNIVSFVGLFCKRDL